MQEILERELTVLEEREDVLNGILHYLREHSGRAKWSTIEEIVNLWLGEMRKESAIEEGNYLRFSMTQSIPALRKKILEYEKEWTNKRLELMRKAVDILRAPNHLQ